MTDLDLQTFCEIIFLKKNRLYYLNCLNIEEREDVVDQDHPEEGQDLLQRVGQDHLEEDQDLPRDAEDLPRRSGHLEEGRGIGQLSLQFT